MKIECSNVSRSFGRTKALDGVSLSFEKGHIIGLLGRNGAGKSTLIKSIGNRIYQDFGSITIEGREIRRSPEDFERIMIVGDENMLPSSTKLKNVFRMLEDSGAGSFDKAMELSRKFKLDVNKKWEKLSTGYRTIFKDIIGLASSREFVFFDEPILGLDANHRELFYEELLSAFSPDRCFVVATHLIEEIAPVIDTVIIIDKGKVLKAEDKDSLLENIYMVSGDRSEVEEATKNCTIISRTSILGQEKVLVEGEVENENVKKERVDLQRYFVEITKDGE
ncbi:MAG: ATP-binding cassette domain-containing protein [Candidatus Ornithospirochaeta sp.]